MAVHESARCRGRPGLCPGGRSEQLHPRCRGDGHHAIGGEFEDQAAGGRARPPAPGTHAAIGSIVRRGQRLPRARRAISSPRISPRSVLSPSSSAVSLSASAITSSARNCPALLKRMNATDPGLVMELHIDASRAVLEAFDGGALDAAIVLGHDAHRRDGDVLFEETFGWMAAPDFRHRARRAAAPCDPGRALQRARHGGERARRRGHSLDRGVRRRRDRNHRCGDIRRSRGRRARTPRGAVRHHRSRRRGLVCRRCRRGRSCCIRSPPTPEHAGRCARLAPPSPQARPDVARKVNR